MSRLPVNRGYVLLPMLVLLIVCALGAWLANLQQPIAHLISHESRLKQLRGIKQVLLANLQADSFRSVLGAMYAPDMTWQGTSAGTGDSGKCLDVRTPSGQPFLRYGEQPHFQGDLRCVGLLPLKDLKLAVGQFENVEQLSRYWYAVSPNVLDVASDPMSPGASCVALLNSRIVAEPAGDALCQSARLPYPWLSLANLSGEVMANDVIAVVVDAGIPLSATSVTGNSVTWPLAEQQLDNYPLKNGLQIDHTGRSQTWRMMPEFNAAAQTLANDEVIWISKEEWIEAVVPHVVQMVVHELPHPFPLVRPPLDATHPAAGNVLNRWQRLERHWGSVIHYEQLSDTEAMITVDGCLSRFHLQWQEGATKVTRDRHCRESGLHV